jgi:hypothetical protein
MSEADFEAMAAPQPVRTGVAAVDDVLDSVDALAQEPVEQHAAVFSAAHDALRRALDAEPEA